MQYFRVEETGVAITLDQHCEVEQDVYYREFLLQLRRAVNLVEHQYEDLDDLFQDAGAILDLRETVLGVRVWVYEQDLENREMEHKYQQ